ncbi:MAG: hypothetical protein ACU84H_13205 [Gammaproteobacteria bacterium]
MAKQGVPGNERFYYLKWLRFYLDFCDKYRLEPFDKRNFAAFDEKLRAKNQSETQRRQARRAIAIYYRGIATREMTGEGNRAEIINRMSPIEVQPSPVDNAHAADSKQFSGVERKKTSTYPTQRHETAPNVGLVSEPILHERKLSNIPEVTEELKLTGANWIWVYEKLKSAIQVRHYSPKTLQSYKIWAQKFQTFTPKQGCAFIDDRRRQRIFDFSCR